MEKRFGVSQSQLNQLRAFQLALLRKSNKIRRPMMKNFGILTVIAAMFGAKFEFKANLSIGNGIILIERTDGEPEWVDLDHIGTVSIADKELTIQKKQEFKTAPRKYSFLFESLQELQKFTALLPKIEPPNEDGEHFVLNNSSSSSDANDSGEVKTQIGLFSYERKGDSSDPEDQDIKMA